MANTNSFAKLRFLCFGVGAIGTYIGGSLARSGQDVVFLERPEQAEAIRKNGLSLSLSSGSYHLGKPHVAPTIEEALTQGPFDAVIFAVKSYHTKSVLKYFTPYSVALPPFICIQNGIGNELILEEVLDSSKIIPASVTTAIGKKGTGNIVVEKQRGIGLAATHSLVPTLVRVFNDAGMNAREFSNPDGMKWSKMLTNLLANATSAILNMSSGEIFEHVGLYRLEMMQLREALRVMRKLKVPVLNLPGTPVIPLSLAARFLPAMVSQPLVKNAVGSGRGGKMPSFHIDLHHGIGKSEVGYLNGAIARLGEEYGISVPVNRLLNDTLQGMTDGEIPINRFNRNPEKFLALLAK